MILADDIMASPGSKDDIVSMGALTRLAGALKDAPKFVLDRSTIGAVRDVSCSSPKSIMSARGYARPPYPKIWLEWRHQDVRDAMDKALEIAPGTYLPDRVGIFVETVPHDPLAGMMTQCWSSEHGLQQSLLCQIYDMGEGDPDLDAVMSQFELPFRIGCTDTEAKVRDDIERCPEMLAEHTRRLIKRDGDQMDHLVAELMRFDFAPNPCTFNMFVAMARSRNRPDLVELCRDWEREALAVVSALILMNSRDLVEREPVSQAKINKKRKRTGKSPLYDHTVIRPGCGMGMPQGGSRSASRAHVVRGHFKVRKGGVFWWSPHVRGDGKLRDRAAYEVRAS